LENMRYAEELVREFLVFTNTLQAYESELSTEIGKNFQVDRILDLVFSEYIPKYQLNRLVGLFTFFKQCFTSPADTDLFLNPC
jgi:WD repeat-containing protein 91